MAKEKAWFERDEHKAIRTCTCLCGNIFEGQARELPCEVAREVKDKNGVSFVGQDGKVKTELVTVMRLLAAKGCPKCLSYWLESFE